MRKLKFGHDPRKLNHKHLEKLITNLSGGEIIDFEKQIEMVMQRHSDTFKKLAETEAQDKVITPVVTEVCPVVEKVVISKYDKWARKHSKLSAKKAEKMMDGLLDDMNSQNEVIHATRGSIHGVAMELERLREQVQILKEQKPVEKHIVTENTIVTTNPHSKLVVGSLALSLVLNIIALILITK
jgi:hypothetical protein